MRALAALFTAVVLALGLGLSYGAAVSAPPAFAAGAHPMPQATKKKTPKPKPSATTASAAPTPSSRTAAEIEGDRWLQLAIIGGGSLLGCVLLFFAIGAFLRRRPRRRRDEPN
jgi:hypothetical protein